MSERIPPHEPVPRDVDVRRDALLLRIAELREVIKKTTFDQEIVSKELDELDAKVQHVEGLLDMRLFEEMMEAWEKMVDSKREL